jgi:hypothetical protein
MANAPKPIGFVFDSENMELAYCCMAVAKQVYKIINKSKASFDRLLIVNVGTNVNIDPFFNDVIEDTAYLSETAVINRLKTCDKILWFSKSPLIRKLQRHHGIIHYQFVDPLNWTVEDKKQSGLYDISLLFSSVVQKEMLFHMRSYEQYNIYPFYGNITADTEKADQETVIVDIMRTASVLHYNNLLQMLLDLLPSTNKRVLLFVPRKLYQFRNNLLDKLESDYADRFVAVVQPLLNEVFEMFTASHYYIDLNTNGAIGFFLYTASQRNTIPIGYRNKLIRDTLNVVTPVEEKIHLIPCYTQDDDCTLLHEVQPDYAAIQDKLASVLQKWTYLDVMEASLRRSDKESVANERMRKYLTLLSSVVRPGYQYIYPRSQRMIDIGGKLTCPVSLLPEKYYINAEY